MKKCFSDPAVFKQLETDCYNAGCKDQVIDCSEFPAAEYRYFARLCGVYAMFKSKAISLEQAAIDAVKLNEIVVKAIKGAIKICTCDGCGR